MTNWTTAKWAKLRLAMDTWKFWILAAYFLLAAGYLGLFLTYHRTTNLITQRHDDIVAQVDAQYEQCVRSIPLIQKVDGFFFGVHELSEALLLNAEASHHATQPGPLYDAQTHNIDRLKHALAIEPSVHIKPTTLKQCKALLLKTGTQ